jgi:serine/threonine-protein kinase
MLAEGGMGEVWRAHDELLDRDVAVKMLRSSLSADPVVAERFRREARAAASLSHPNMANVFDYVEEARKPGIVMELVEGRTLADVIAERAPMSADEALAIMHQVLDALQAAHTAGVVHRDIKPANVMIDGKGRAKVTDFGIARALGESTLTETGIVLGSVHYVAPEQLQGDAPAPAGDIYAAGVMLYEMLTAKRPFEGETPVAIAMSRLSNDPVPPRRWRGGLSPQLEAVIIRALSRNPAARFATAADMKAALHAAAGAAPREAGVEHTLVLPVESTSRLRSRTTSTTAIGKPAPEEPGSRRRIVRRFARPVLLVLALLLIAGGIAAFIATRPPANVSVPRFEGKQISEAIDVAENEHLHLRVTGRPTSATPRGTVLSQSIPPGTIVRSASTVGVVVSAGPPECCTVPDVVGQALDEARDAIEGAGLEVSVSFRVTEEPTGAVVDQTPPPGAFLSRGDKVAIVVDVPEERRGKGKGRGD